MHLNLVGAILNRISFGFNGKSAKKKTFLSRRVEIICQIFDEI